MFSARFLGQKGRMDSAETMILVYDLIEARGRVDLKSLAVS